MWSFPLNGGGTLPKTFHAKTSLTRECIPSGPEIVIILSVQGVNEVYETCSPASGRISDVLSVEEPHNKYPIGGALLLVL